MPPKEVRGLASRQRWHQPKLVLGIVRHATAQYEKQIGTVQAELGDAAQRAPAGAEVAVTAMNSAITAANAFYESVWKTVQQAVQTAESNVNVMTRSATSGSHAA